MYFIKQESMGGCLYYMIYKRFWIFSHFHERWNTSESAQIRLSELKNK